MRVIGLTGGIASGKSTVSRRLRELGAPVVDADAIVHEIQAKGTPVLAAIAAEFGPGVLRPDGSLDRAALGSLVFKDPERRKQLEAIVHPAVRERMRAEKERYRQEGRLVLVLDVPLLIEGGQDRSVNEVWVVYVDRAIQLERLIARDGLSLQEALRRLAAQMDLEAKRARADVLLDNRGTLAATVAQVDAAWALALDRARSGQLTQ